MWLIALAIVAAAAAVVVALRAPRDNERAQLLAQLAADAAAVVVNLMPTAAWSELLQAVIQRLAGVSTRPTRNTVVLTTAATAALVRLGKTAPATTPPLKKP